MKIRTRAYFLLGVVLVAMVTNSVIALYNGKAHANDDNRARIEQLMRSTYLGIVELEKMAAEGVLTEEQAKAIATRLTRENKYHPSEYSYVVDEKLNFVATPLDPQLHGTSFHEFKDDQGRSVGEKAVSALQESGGKLTDYWWSTIREGEKVNVLSVAIQTPRWKWIVGNGVSFSEANARFWSGATVQLLCGLIGTLVIAIAMLLGTRRLLTVLGGEPEVVIERLRRVSAGDLADYPSDIKPASENSVMGVTEKMRDSLRGLVMQLAESSQSIQELCNDIATGSKDLSQRTTETTARLEKTSGSLGDLNQAIKDNVSMSRHAHEMADTASNVAVRGGASMAEVVSTMQQINASSNKINDIIGVIDGIAFQTNLLALNAAVEAARAGENGRGFAVVASEVRNLAKRSSGAAKEIKELISDTTSRIQSGGQLVDGAGLTMQEIVTTGKGVSNTVSEINTIAIGQSSNIETLSADMRELEHMTKQNAALVDITDHATTQMLAHAEKLSTAVGAFKL